MPAAFRDFLIGRKLLGRLYIFHGHHVAFCLWVYWFIGVFYYYTNRLISEITAGWL